MFIELGHFAAIAAFIVVIAQACGLLLLRHPSAPPLIVGLSRSQFFLLSFSLISLITAYVTSDFTVANVAENSHSLKPLLYKISGTIGNHEGSILFWVWVLSLYSFLFSFTGSRNRGEFAAAVAGIQGAISAGFIGFMLFTSNPFLRAFPAAAEGNDLNPLLQDPGLAFHPPLLYLGYVGFSLTFAICAAALWRRTEDKHWIAQMRPWALLAWSFLTLGIALGSYWAYYELGWGGFWFWDPVENASLLPWLSGTALIHSLIVSDKRDTFKPWTAFLSLLTFTLSLIGTFLVRSGILTSVHAFANDPGRGLYLLMIIGILSGAGFLLFGLRASLLKKSVPFGFFTRENGIMLNNLFLSVCCATVLLGTLYPLILDLAVEKKVTVGPPYFALTFVPLFMPVIACMALAPFLRWKNGNWTEVQKDAVPAFAAAIIVGVAAALFSYKGILAALSITLGAFLVCAMLYALYKRHANGGFKTMSKAFLALFFAHIGLGISVIGIGGTVFWQQEKIAALQMNGETEIAGFRVTLKNVYEADIANYTATIADVAFQSGGAQFIMRPEKRFYPSQGMTTTEAAIRTNGFRDIYVALGDYDKESGRFALRLHYKPLAPWIWLGALVMALGGFVACYGQFKAQQFQKFMPEITLPQRRVVAGLAGLKIAAIVLYFALGAPDFVIHPDMNLPQRPEHKEKINAQTIRLLQGAARDNPQNADAFLALGMAYARQGNADEARAAFARAHEIDPVMTEQMLAPMLKRGGATGKE